jgi:hypothetical protein
MLHVTTDLCRRVPTNCIFSIVLTRRSPAIFNLFLKNAFCLSEHLKFKRNLQIVQKMFYQLFLKHRFISEHPIRNCFGRFWLSRRNFSTYEKAILFKGEITALLQ